MFCGRLFCILWPPESCFEVVATCEKANRDAAKPFVFLRKSARASRASCPGVTVPSTPFWRFGPENRPALDGTIIHIDGMTPVLALRLCGPSLPSGLCHVG